MSAGTEQKASKGASNADGKTPRSNPWTQWLGGFSGLGQGVGADLYKQIAKDWEQWLGGQFDKLARNEAFLGQVGKALESSFVARGQINRWLEQSLKGMRLPTLGDLEEVHQRLDAIERRLDALAERLDGLTAAPPAKSAAEKEVKPAAEKEAKPASRSGGRSRGGRAGKKTDSTPNHG